MKIYKIADSRQPSAVSVLKSYAAPTINLTKYKWKAGSQPPAANLKTIAPPIDMAKMLHLLDMDEYHYACVDAIAESCFVKLDCKNAHAKSFLENMQLPAGEDIISIMSDLVHYYIACGNGFLLKLRNLKGEWVSINRLIPSEVAIVERYDKFGFLAPDYLQVKAGQKTFIKGDDVIHMLQRNSLSNAWGLACKPIILNIETLAGIKEYDFNRFQNGLLIDYFILVEGGSLGEKYTEIGEDGVERTVDPYADFTQLLAQAKGIKNAHGSIVVETPDPNTKIRLEPMRAAENNFEQLKHDLREGIIVYHRVPHRLVSQETAGKLGGDNNSDLNVFFNMVIKPLQERVASILTHHLNTEFSWGVKPSDFDFGDISEVLESIETRVFR